MKEGFSKGSILTPEETQRIKDAYQVADPTTYSELPAKGEIVDLGAASEKKFNRLVSINDEKYVTLEGGSSDASQFVITKLLKGIINVSDIVRDEQGNFYSKVMPLDKIQEETPVSEIEGDFFVIKSLTGDGDRGFAPASENLTQYTKNVMHEKGKTAYFDFGFARQLDPKINTAEYAGFTDLEALESADRKLADIYKRLNGTMGTLFIKSIMKETGSTVKEIFPAFEGEGLNGDEEDILTLQASLLQKTQQARSEVYNRSILLRASM